MLYEVLKTIEFDDWFLEETPKSRFQILKRIQLIIETGHFGTCKKVSEMLWELKWKNGRRVYYSYIEELKLLLLLGGNKNGQSKDIKKAQKLFKRYQIGSA